MPSEVKSKQSRLLFKVLDTLLIVVALGLVVTIYSVVSYLPSPQEISGTLADETETTS